jgi:hypothetical protein
VNTGDIFLSGTTAVIPDAVEASEFVNGRFHLSRTAPGVNFHILAPN